MLTNFELEKLLISWKKKEGDERIGKSGDVYYKIEDARKAFNALINTLIERGYTLENFSSSTLSDKIIDSILPAEYNKTKLEKWRAILKRKWMEALADVFPDTIQEAGEAKERPEKKREPMPTNDVVERPALDKSKLRGLVLPVIEMVDEDPLEFLKKEQK